MQYALYSDIHSNLQALEAVIADMSTLGECRKIFLGDAVGYGAHPNECVDLIRDISEYAVAGNHDHAALGKTSIAYFNPYAKRAILWTRDTLFEKNKQYLAGLAFEQDLGSMHLVHATPCDPTAWSYIFSLKDAFNNFCCFSQQICFIGHSHIPAILNLNLEQQRCFVHIGNPVFIKKGCRYLINIGSVGQPRDGDNRSSYAVFDDETKKVTIRRVSYDILASQKAIVAAGLPRHLAQRLEQGR